MTTMMVDPFDALAPAIQGWESIGAISPKMPPWLAEDATLADPSQDRFDPVDDLENLHLTGLDEIGQVAFFAFLENPIPSLQGLPLKYGF